VGCGWLSSSKLRDRANDALQRLAPLTVTVSPSSSSDPGGAPNVNATRDVGCAGPATLKPVQGVGGCGDCRAAFQNLRSRLAPRSLASISNPSSRRVPVFRSRPQPPYLILFLAR
jgi:hypothetical protein